MLFFFLFVRFLLCSRGKNLSEPQLLWRHHLFPACWEQHGDPQGQAAVPIRVNKSIADIHFFFPRRLFRAILQCANLSDAPQQSACTCQSLNGVVYVVRKPRLIYCRLRGLFSLFQKKKKKKRGGWLSALVFLFFEMPGADVRIHYGGWKELKKKTPLICKTPCFLTTYFYHEEQHHHVTKELHRAFQSF